MSKNFPKLKFRLNKTLDKKVGFHFLEHKKAGVNFGAKIIKDYPELKAAQKSKDKKKEKIISSYVKSFYLKNDKELKQTRLEFQDEWNKNAEAFFTAANKLFNNHSWPKGKYHAYLSIFNCNPRFLKNKTFQVYWKHPKGVVAVSSHEMLHFFFYDYVEKNFSKKPMSENSLWQLSEIFNHFVLAEPDFVKLTNVPKPSLYPNLVNLSKELRPLWEKSKSAHDFLRLSLKDISNSKPKKS